MQYFVEAKAMALRRVSKEDMRHIAKATGATQVHTVLLSSFISHWGLAEVLLFVEWVSDLIDNRISVDQYLY